MRHFTHYFRNWCRSSWRAHQLYYPDSLFQNLGLLGGYNAEKIVEFWAAMRKPWVLGSQSIVYLKLLRHSLLCSWLKISRNGPIEIHAVPIWERVDNQVAGGQDATGMLGPISEELMWNLNAVDLRICSLVSLSPLGYLDVCVNCLQIVNEDIIKGNVEKSLAHWMKVLNDWRHSNWLFHAYHLPVSAAFQYYLPTSMSLPVHERHPGKKAHHLPEPS